MRERVEEAIEKIRPALQADGGDIRLVDVKDNVVTVELQGA
ncbi:MAG TPA: NifU family protein, partial [Armatimonadota bacterium]|nr:NifU family protein [Armatimonadota bacterium]